MEEEATSKRSKARGIQHMRTSTSTRLATRASRPTSLYTSHRATSLGHRVQQKGAGETGDD